MCLATCMNKYFTDKIPELSVKCYLFHIKQNSVRVSKLYVECSLFFTGFAYILKSKTENSSKLVFC